MGCKFCNDTTALVDLFPQGIPEGFSMVISQSDSGAKVLVTLYNDGIDTHFQIYDINYCLHCGEKLNQEITK